MNFTSAAKITFGLPGQSSWEPVSTQQLMAFATALIETFQALEIFADRLTLVSERNERMFTVLVFTIYKHYLCTKQVVSNTLGR